MKPVRSSAIPQHPVVDGRRWAGYSGPMPDPDFRTPYLSRGLIAYIGNKRSLLPFISQVLERCAQESLEGVSARGPCALRLLDPFAGSGSVSRLARHLGFAVGTNDREYYAALIGQCRVVLDPVRLETAFEGEGGSVLAFAALDAFANGVPPQAAAGILKTGGARTLWLRAFENGEAQRMISRQRRNWRRATLTLNQKFPHFKRFAIWPQPSWKNFYFLVIPMMTATSLWKSKQEQVEMNQRSLLVTYYACT